MRDVTCTWAGATETATPAAREGRSRSRRGSARIDRFPRARYDLELHYQEASNQVKRRIRLYNRKEFGTLLCLRWLLFYIFVLCGLVYVTRNNRSGAASLLDPIVSRSCMAFAGRSLTISSTAARHLCSLTGSQTTLF